VRQLLPRLVEEVDPREVYGADDRSVAAGTPWLMVNMVASLDGATAMEGRAAGLGGPGDRAIFRILRGLADVILVAAGTVRAERYKPHRPTDEVRARRVARGQSPTAPIAVVTATLALDVDTPFFTEAQARPIVFCPATADADRRRELEAVADVVPVGEERVDLRRALAELGRRGVRVVLSEGGPSLVGQLVEEGLIDELCLTLSPWMVNGLSPRVAYGAPATDGPARFDLARVLEGDGGFLFLRYVRQPDPADEPE
jgi:riboflavin biosynthesis pyrimidine reductase